MEELQYLTEDDYYKALGEKCQKRREDLDISVKEMITQTGLSRSLLYEFETKGKKISAFRLNKVLKTLGLPTIDDSFNVPGLASCPVLQLR